ncbi:hypothetical protein ACFYVL_09170 [Streptomyces sp. NPDC004111]|uniref:hypothetical protein n=1 Tax=Streptomyces sp. NPDC004111 TaxID=3364690 RepID=UPI0036A66917
MSLQAREFFAELGLPFRGTTVGNTHYVNPGAGSPLRLKISFTDTRYRNTYGGLLLTLTHVDRGQLDSVALSFADHGTFTLEDSLRRRNIADTFNVTLAGAGQPAWAGADTTGLSDAIERYASTWFPGEGIAPAPLRAPSRAPHTTPAPPAARQGARAR